MGLYDTFKSFQQVLRTVGHDLSREKAGISSVYNIDYSLLFMKLHPTEARSEEDLGMVIYAFDKKDKEDTYVLLPWGAWESLNHLKGLVDTSRGLSSFNRVINHPKIKPFYDVMAGPPSDPMEKAEKLKAKYIEMGKIGSILLLADDEQLDASIRQSMLNAKELIQSGTIVPLEKVIENVEDVQIDEQVYNAVYDYLSVRRRGKNDSNQVDSYYAGTTYAENLAFYRSNSSLFTYATGIGQPYKISRYINWKDPFGTDPICRGPTAIVTKMLCKEIFQGDLDEAISYCNRGERLLTFLKKHIDELDDSDTFLATMVAAGEINQEKVNNAIHKTGLLQDNYREYSENYWEKLILRAIKINAGKFDELQKLKKDRAKKIAQILSNKEEYENSMSKVHDTIKESLKDASNGLADFINEKYAHLLTPQMKESLQIFKGEK